jgi:hypothetical protein
MPLLAVIADSLHEVDLFKLIIAQINLKTSKQALAEAGFEPG